jgi:hypothetical protein
MNPEHENLIVQYNGLDKQVSELGKVADINLAWSQGQARIIKGGKELLGQQVSVRVYVTAFLNVDCITIGFATRDTLQDAFFSALIAAKEYLMSIYNNQAFVAEKAGIEARRKANALYDFKVR